METTERQGLGTDPKMEVDYSVTCDEKLPEFQKMAKAGKIKEALEGLVVLEKQTRTVNLKCYEFENLNHLLALH